LLRRFETAEKLNKAKTEDFELEMTEFKLALGQCKGEASGPLSANIRISFKIFNKLLEIFIFIQSISWPVLQALSWG